MIYIKTKSNQINNKKNERKVVNFYLWKTLIYSVYNLTVISIGQEVKHIAKLFRLRFFSGFRIVRVLVVSLVCFVVVGEKRRPPPPKSLPHTLGIHWIGIRCASDYHRRTDSHTQCVLLWTLTFYTHTWLCRDCQQTRYS